MTDEQLIALLDTQQPYYVAVGLKASAMANSLRQAVLTAHKFSGQGLTPTIARLGDNQKIPPDQIWRLWKHLDL